jgi:chromosome segregation ATPase
MSEESIQIENLKDMIKSLEVKIDDKIKTLDDKIDGNTKALDDKLKDKTEAIWQQVEESKCQRSDIFSRVTSLEINRGEMKEQLTSIKEFLERIDKSLNSISTELSALKQQPAKDYGKFKWAIVTSLICAIIGAIVGYIIKKG